MKSTFAAISVNSEADIWQLRGGHLRLANSGHTDGKTTVAVTIGVALAAAYST
jgi:hypothetical protein